MKQNKKKAVLKVGYRQSSWMLNALPDACQQQPLVVAAGFPLDPASQVAAVALLVCSSDIRHVVSVPIYAAARGRQQSMPSAVRRTGGERDTGVEYHSRKRTTRLTSR